MQLSGQHIVGGFGLVFAAMIAWFGALWLNLQGTNLWFVRLCIFLLLGLVVVAVVWWLRNRQKTKPSGEASSSSATPLGAGVAEDILLILREAQGRVASSTQLPRGTRLSSLPVIFLLGDAASGKTCVATQSGLDPELISGQVYQEGNIAPTRLANVWFARKTIFVEMAGKTLGDEHLWSRLLHRLAPGKLRSIFSTKAAAPRAAVVCYDSTKLAKAAGAEEMSAQARSIRARLQQISQTLGISFPVYVFFTQADRLPYFDDFFRNLNDQETTQVLGATFPPFPATATGVYAEQETKRLTGAFNSIFYSLAECRPGLLYRERGAGRLPGIYEFPRELQKRIPLAVQFLVDLCRPSHLRSGPFLRGFYFTGVRQVETAAPFGGTMLASKTSLMPTRSFAANATSIMRTDDFTRTQGQGWQSATQTGLAAESGKTSQWLFLSHILSHVVLQDHTALGASGASSRANVWKRVLLATAGGIAAIWLLGMVISFFGNRALEEDVRRAAEAISPIRSTPLSMASLEDLQHLDAARLELARLTKYHRGGAPLRLRWGLYSGESLYDDFRPLYFDRFNKLLFGDVQGQMASFLHNRPSSPANASDDDYNTAYDTLKGYLMTTLRPEKSETPFLSEFLLNEWAGKLDPTSNEQKNLAHSQFAFYADELRVENPFPLSSDNPFVHEAVDQSRRYLAAFTGANFVYRTYIAKVHQVCPKCEPLNFAKKYPETEGVVRESKIVDAAYTKDGWKAMQGLLSRNDWKTDDEWVLGEGAKAVTRVVNIAEVRSDYQTDYIREWREFVKSASVVGLGGPGDAPKKLGRLTGNRSPLFELLCEVSENTSETSPEISTAFLPVSDVVKAPCYNQVAQESSKGYVAALNDFYQCIEQFQEDPKNPATQREDNYRSCRIRQSPPIQTQARVLVKSIDHEAHLDECVVTLLQLGTCGRIPPPPPPPRALCIALNSLSSKYPFKNDTNDEATLEEFESFFRPGTGVLSRDVASGGAKIAATANVVKFAQKIQSALYPNGSSTLQYHFTVTTAVPPGMKSARLNLDGAVLNLNESASTTQSFIWPGKSHEAELRFADSTSLGPFAGPWAVFNLMRNFNWSGGGGAEFRLESRPLGTLGIRQKLDFKTAGASVPLFQGGYLSKLRCPSR